MLWAAAARLTAAPAFLAVLAFSLYQVRKNRRQWNTILVVIGLQTLVLAVVPLILAGERMVFDIWTSQEFRSGQRTLAPPIGTVLRAKALFLTALLSWFPLVTILMLALGVFLFLRWRDGWRPSLAGLAEWPTAQLLMLALAAFLFLPHLALEALQPFYFVPAFPIVALMAASAIHRLGSVLSPRPEWMILPSLVAALLLIEGLTFASAFPDRINTADPHLLELREAAKYLKSAVPSEKRVVTFDTSVVLEANRRVANGLEMAQFSFWPGFKTSDARHYGVVNHEILRELVASDDTGAVVFSDMDQIVIASTNPYPAPPDAEQRELLSYEVFPELEEEYRLAKEFSHFGQFGDTLYILVRTD
jgi:hypothetical protein